MASHPPRGAAAPCACVLVIGGHDPSSAGIQADIETCAAHGCLALSVITALTTQNTAGLHAIRASAATDLIEQVDLLLAEFPLAAIKVGMVPNRALTQALGGLLGGRLAGIPLVVDPVLRTGSGRRLADEGTAEAWLECLLPHARIVTPNHAEAMALSGAETTAAAAERLLATGCAAVLITDVAPGDALIVNELHLAGAPARRFEMERYAGEYHGTGCTLASAIAARLAHGDALGSAVEAAQRYVHQAVANAHHFGARQAIPNRLARTRS